jgi:hypothetical protein
VLHQKVPRQDNTRFQANLRTDALIIKISNSGINLHMESQHAQMGPPRRSSAAGGTAPHGFTA